MIISLSKKQLLERFEQRQVQFGDAVEKRMKPELPFTVESYEDLSGKCAVVVAAFVETVFAEDE
ncbi:hypothetical protein ACFLUJ_06120 [Chloroflexota bacterium]